VRIVLDTNILIGALITQGTPPDQLYQAWLRDAIELVTSRAQIDELAAVVARPRLRPYIDPGNAATVIENIDTRAVIVGESTRHQSFARSQGQPDTRHGIAGTAELIVSGNKNHMLAFEQVEGIPIVTVRQALAWIGRQY
jgi:putative PIN family toxin of toxin-antitoxin system